MNSNRLDRFTIGTSCLIFCALIAVVFFKTEKVVIDQPKVNITESSKFVFELPTNTNQPKIDLTPKVTTKEYSLPVFIGSFIIEGEVDQYGLKGNSKYSSSIDNKEYVQFSVSIEEGSVYQIFTEEGQSGNIYGYPNSFVVLEKEKKYYITKSKELKKTQPN